MASTTKRDSKNTKAKPRHAVVKKSPVKQAQTIAELRQQLAESLQREKATAKERQEAVEQQKRDERSPPHDSQLADRPAASTQCGC